MTRTCCICRRDFQTPNATRLMCSECNRRVSSGTPAPDRPQAQPAARNPDIWQHVPFIRRRVQSERGDT